MNAPKVSVTMPCFNCADTLPAAVASILSQTMQDFEIVAVDDGSSDATADVLRDLARQDRRIRPLFLPHQGVALAANAAVEAAQGAYVARQDADDVSLPRRLEVQAGMLDADPTLGVAGCRVRFGGDAQAGQGYARYVDWINGLLRHEDIFLNRFIESPFAHPSMMYRRDVALRHGLYREGPFPEDYEFILRLLEAGVRMEKSQEELLVWNDPPTRLSRTHPRYDVMAFYRTKTEFLCRWLAAHNPHHPRVVAWGAGRLSRRRSDLLAEHGVEIAAYVDVDPKKTGRPVQGRPVWLRERLPAAGECFVLAYVASRGARGEIREFLAQRGYVEGKDFLCVAGT